MIRALLKIQRDHAKAALTISAANAESIGQNVGCLQQTSIQQVGGLAGHRLARRLVLSSYFTASSDGAFC